jgi:NACHT domain
VLLSSSSETQDDMIKRLVAYSKFVKDDLDQFGYSRIKTTCQWILEDPSFKDWLTDTKGFLWLSGPAGFGKSFLISKIVEFLKDKVKKDRQGERDDALLVYFFCRATDTAQRSLKNGMWAMIGQLADQNKEYANEIGPLLKSTGIDSLQSSAIIPRIWRRFISDFKHLFRRRHVFMVVDGLDECERTERQQFLQEAFRLCLEDPGSIRILCSSRPEVLREVHEIETPEERLIIPPTIVVESQTESDIQCFVNAKMRRTRFAKDKKMRSKVQSSVISNARGMFLWADLTMREVSQAQTAEDVENVIDHIVDAHNLNELYDSVLESLYRNSSKRQVQIINEILAWVTNAIQDLNFSKLKQAIEFSIETKIFGLKEEIDRCGSLFEIGGLSRYITRKSDSALHDKRNTEEGVLLNSASFEEEKSSGSDDSCSLEDTTEDELYWDGIVRIRHATLHEYFERGDQSSPLGVDQQRVHEMLAITCMKAIISTADEDDLPEFLDYAYSNWAEHLHRVTVEHESVSRIYPILSTMFGRWNVTKRWILHSQPHISPSRLRMIETFFVANDELQAKTTEANSSSDLQQNLSRIYSIWKLVVKTATESGFFRSFPNIGDDMSMQDNRFITTYLMWLSYLVRFYPREIVNCCFNIL